jgi:hypothetical protein
MDDVGNDDFAVDQPVERAAATAPAPAAARQREIAELSPEAEADAFDVDGIDINPAEFDGSGSSSLAADVPIGGDDDFDDSAIMASPAETPSPLTEPDEMANEEFEAPAAEPDELALDEIEELATTAKPTPRTPPTLTVVTDVADDLDFGELEPEELPLDGDLEPVMADVEPIGGEDEDLDLATADFEPVEFEDATAGGDDVFEEVSFAETPAAAAPAPAPSAPAALRAAPEPAAEDEDEFAAPEIGEDEADAFEEKLNASIAEEESMPEPEDANSHDRAEAMRLIEAHAELPSVDAVAENLGVADGFGDLGIDHDDELAAEDGAAGVGDGATDGEGAGGGFEFAGFDFTEDGKLSLRFASGASLNLDPGALANGSGRRVLTVAGSRIVVRRTKSGLAIEVDGVEIVLPAHAA